MKMTESVNASLMNSLHSQSVDSVETMATDGSVTVVH